MARTGLFLCTMTCCERHGTSCELGVQRARGLVFVFLLLRKKKSNKKSNTETVWFGESETVKWDPNRCAES